MRSTLESFSEDDHCVLDDCRWIRPLLSLPSTQLATLTTSPSATSLHMEMRKRNPNHPDSRVITWSCRNINGGWKNVEVSDSFILVRSVGIKIVLFLLMLLRVFQEHPGYATWFKLYLCRRHSQNRQDLCAMWMLLVTPNNTNTITANLGGNKTGKDYLYRYSIYIV